MSKIIFIYVFVHSNFLFSQEQNYWMKWDDNYKNISVSKLIEYEKDYHQYFFNKENKLKGELNYTRIDSFKFKATYLGDSKNVEKSILNSIERVFTINSVQFSILDNIKKSLLFKIEDDLYWMPVQEVLVNSFRKEVEKGDNVMLYCAFLNESIENPLTLNNIFIISEFKALK